MDVKELKEGHTMSKTVKEIVRDYLIRHKYDGLYCEDYVFCVDNCGCELSDLFPCGEIYEYCKPGYKAMCDCGDGCAFHIVPEK